MKKVSVLTVLILVAICAVFCVSCFGGETSDDNGGNDNANDIYYLYFEGEGVDIERIPLVGGTVTLPAEPERVGYEFGGWYTDKNFTVTLKEHLQKGIDGNVIAYAKWIPLGYTVVVNSYRGNGGGELFTKGAGIPHGQLNSRLVASTDKDLRSCIIQYLKEHGEIDARPLWQWKFVPEEWAVPACRRDRALLFGRGAKETAAPAPK